MTTCPSLRKGWSKGRQSGLNSPLLFLVVFSGFLSLRLSDPSSLFSPAFFSSCLCRFSKAFIRKGLPQSRSLSVGLRGHPPRPPGCNHCIRLLLGEACCWVFGGTPGCNRPLRRFSGAPTGCDRLLRGEACCWVCGGTPQLQSTSTWRSLLVGLRGHTRLPSTSSLRSLLLSLAAPPPAAIDFFVAKFVGGFSGAPLECNPPLRTEAC